MRTSNILPGVLLLSVGCASAPTSPDCISPDAVTLLLTPTPATIAQGQALYGDFSITNTSTGPLTVCRATSWGFEPTAGMPGHTITSSHDGCRTSSCSSLGPGQ